VMERDGPGDLRIIRRIGPAQIEIAHRPAISRGDHAQVAERDGAIKWRFIVYGGAVHMGKLLERDSGARRLPADDPGVGGANRRDVVGLRKWGFDAFPLAARQAQEHNPISSCDLRGAQTGHPDLAIRPNTHDEEPYDVSCWRRGDGAPGAILVVEQQRLLAL